MLSGGLERDQSPSGMKWIKKNLLLLVYHHNVIVSNLHLLLTIFSFFTVKKLVYVKIFSTVIAFFSQFISSVPDKVVVGY